LRLLFGFGDTNYYLKILIVQLTVINMREYRFPDPKDDQPGPKPKTASEEEPVLTPKPEVEVEEEAEESGK
jgi:hypothetical protein